MYIILFVFYFTFVFIFACLKNVEFVLEKMQYKCTKLLKNNWKRTKINFMAKCCLLASALYSNHKTNSFIHLKCFLSVHPLYAKSFYDRNKMFGFVAKCKKYDVIAFRSTVNIDDVMLTYDNSIMYTKHGGVHSGYYKQAIKLLTNLPRLNRKIILTGHSLGGSLATILGYILSDNPNNAVSVFTFGSPKCGEELFCSRIKNRKNFTVKNIINTYDDVCNVPKKYNHIGSTKEYTHNTGSLLKNHSIYTYLTLSNDDVPISNYRNSIPERIVRKLFRSL
jgi:hypothetical protein